MSERKELGSIQAASFGQGGYQDAMIGFSVSLGGKGWGVGDFWGTWRTKPSASAEWTEESRARDLGAVVMRVNDILRAAKKADVAKLVGTPIEATFEGNRLMSWRVLEEVL